MLSQLFTISFTAFYSQSKDTLMNTITRIDNKLLDSNESNLIQHILFGNLSKDIETNIEILNRTVSYVLMTKRFDERLFWRLYAFSLNVHVFWL